MHIHINHKCIAYIFKCDYLLQLFHKIVLYSLALENKFFSFADLQNTNLYTSRTSYFSFSPKGWTVSLGQGSAGLKKES